MIYVIAEANHKRNGQMIAKAREITETVKDSGVKLIFLQPPADESGMRYAVDEIVVMNGDPRHRYYNNEALAGTLIRMIDRDGADMVLFPSTPQCRELAALISARTDRTLITDCADLRAVDGDCVAVKPSPDGSHFASYRFAGERPYLAVLKSAEVKEEKARGYANADGGAVHEEDTDPAEPEGIRLISVEYNERVKTDIRDAELIFAGGRGMLNADSFLELRKLAKLYNASVGGSRPVVDSGWASVDEQVGQTGSFVRPKVYVAFGISGAVQHLAGMKDSRYIIAVNIQKNSPIFGYCDYGAYSDANSIIRNMLNLLHQSQNETEESI